SSIVTAVLALALVVGIGASLINLYVNRERDRDLQQWESRLGLVLDAKAQALADRLAADEKALQELADNASLQLYLSQVIQSRKHSEGSPASSAQQGYLRNLLLAEARRHGFMPPDTPAIPANLPPVPMPGLGLFDTGLKPVVMTPGLYALSPPFSDAARQALKTGHSAISAFHRDEQGRPLLAIAVPVRAVLGADRGGMPGPVGVLIAVRDAAHWLFPALATGGTFSQDSETLLLERRGDSVVYVTPTRDGAGPMSKQMPVDRKSLAGAAAVTRPGRFEMLDNYQGRPVLQLSRPVGRKGWVLVEQVDAAQALQESNARRRFLITTLSLVLLSIAALFVAAWRHGSSVRARHRAADLGEIAEKLRKQTELLHAVTDNIDTLILLLDRQSRIVFTNRALADAVGSPIRDLIGNHLSPALGPSMAKELLRAAEQARLPDGPAVQPLRLQFGTQARQYQVSFIPVEQLGNERNLLLVVLTDITELELAQARHANLLSNLVSTLVEVIDLHDPYSAFHSARMAEIADELAAELGLSDQERQTLRFAATLANIGKIMLPRDVLLKTDELSAEERKLLETHVERGLELLHKLDFDGPVLSTIAQKQELLDGSGYPRGLTEQQMSLPGRILAVANAFVALVSPRAYREAVSVNDALEILMSAPDKYDRHVVAALVHVAQNRLDWSRWSRRGPAEPE
ncbi:MAG TPA: HD domain-containing protein, partial [Chromatiales bacterium]|nr:HD domain-containing protein [Chromatiales bacterium]